MERKEFLKLLTATTIGAFILPRQESIAGSSSLEELWESDPPPTRNGLITHYDPGLMEEVINNRIAMGQLDEKTMGNVPRGSWAATNFKKEIGSLVSLKLGDRSIRPLLVVDCVSLEDLPAQLRLGRIGEISYELAVNLGIVDIPTEAVIRTLRHQNPSRMRAI